MKREIYISNLAFSNHNFNLLKKIVKNYNLQGIDFAPINLWNNWTNLKKKIFVLKNFLEKNKIKINAVQGIFYKKDFNLFDDKKMTKKKISKHIMMIINMCEKIKCKKIIIGSSNFRKKEDLDLKKADDIFIKFFSKYKKRFFLLIGLLLLMTFGAFIYTDNVKKKRAEISNKFIKASLNYNQAEKAQYLEEFIFFINLTK